MIWMNMGPRGRMNGHRGLGSGILPGLLGLIFGGWILLAVLGSVIGAGVLVFSSVFAVLANIVAPILSAVFSANGLIIGVIIGLIWYYSGRKNREYTSRDEEEDKDDFTTPKAENWNS